MMVEQMLILAGGQGSRLRDSIPGIPKILAPIGNEPFLYYLLRYYRAQGVRRFHFCLGHMAEQVLSYLKNNGYAFTYSIEKTPLGTGGAILDALANVSDETVAVTNGDTYVTADLHRAVAFHETARAACTLVLASEEDAVRFGYVTKDKEGRIQSFEEKGKHGPGLVNTGCYILDRGRFIQGSRAGAFSFEYDYLRVKAAGGEIFGMEQEVYFRDIGVPSDLIKAQKEIPAYDARLVERDR